MEPEVRKFLEGAVKDFFAAWPLKPEVEMTEEEQVAIVQINTGKDFLFTQPNAQPLLALQHLLRMMLRKEFPDFSKKLLVDMGGFRQEQQTALEKVAKEAIWQAKASGNSVHLSPMSSFERRCIHMLVADEPNLMSESTGTGDSRHVVIKLTSQ